MADAPERAWYAAVRSMLPRLRRITLGVRAVVRWNGLLVLVRHRFHDRERWYLPGGAVDAREDAAASCLREIEEEAGIPRRALTVRSLAGAFVNTFAVYDDHVLLFVVDAAEPPGALPLSLEIAEARAFAPDALPSLSPATARRIAEVRESEAGPPR